VGFLVWFEIIGKFWGYGCCFVEIEDSSRRPGIGYGNKYDSEVSGCLV